MSGGSRRATRIRAKPSAAASSEPESDQPLSHRRRDRSHDHGPIRLMNVQIRTLLGSGFGFLALLFVAFFFVYVFDAGSDDESTEVRRLMRVVTPLPAPKMMNLPQFQGEHKESLYWGTYRPHVYLGIRARTPASLIAGLMWIGIKNGQYFLRHVCQGSDDLSTYGWTDHNGRDYGRQVIVDQGLSLTTSFLKEKGHGSGYGGDWAVRVNVQNEKLWSEEKWSEAHLFFYLADEEGNSLSVGPMKLEFHEGGLLAFGSHEDIDDWELHLKSPDNLEMHHAGFRTLHMHNLTELVQGTLAVYARRTGQLQLPDASDDSPNILVFQISAKLPSTFDFAFVSGTNLKNSRVEERVDSLTGSTLTSQLKGKQEELEEKYVRCFDMKDKVDPEAMVAGRAALGNLLGGIGYFYGRSKISLPKGFKKQKDGNNFLSYWPAALFTTVPSRSVFPRGFLWDEGFHQLIIWRWDIKICMDIVGHWLDLINMDGWIPREQILGAEAISKVPEEFVLQHPSNGNPPTLFLLLRDLISNKRAGRFSAEENNEIDAFLDRAYNRLGAWFEWFNSTQFGKDTGTFHWHGRDKTTITELNPKTLSSGLDDYPRASHPSDDERHLDLRCWMLLAANCMHSISELLGTKDGLEKDYHGMARELSNFEILNQMHLDDVSGAYFDFGNHTEKVRLRWHEIKSMDTVKRELVRETLEKPQLSLVPHVGYVSLFPFMMGIIPSDSWVLGKQLELISNRSTLWTDYGLRSLSKTSSIYMKRNTEHDAPYWRGPIWINMNYLILSALRHYSQEDGPYRDKAQTLYKDLRSNLIRNIVRNYKETGFLWEQYDQKNKGRGKGAHPFTGWTSLVLLIMAEAYPAF